MAEGKLSSWGSYCCFLNTSFAQGFLYTPIIFQYAGCTWLCVLLFLVAQVMTYVTAKQLISLSESVQPQVSTIEVPLLTASPNSAIEVDLPTLIKSFFSTRQWRNALYIFALFVSLTYCVQLLISFAHFFALHVEGLGGEGLWWYTVGMLVYVGAICGLSCFNLKESEAFHSLGAVARVGLVVLLCCAWDKLASSGINFGANRPDKEGKMEILPLALLICFMQVAVPGLMAASASAKAASHSLVFASATFFVMCVSVGWVASSHPPSNSDSLLTTQPNPDSVLYLYLVLIGLVIVTCSHIFARTLASMIVAWRYSTNLQWAKELYPKRVNALYYISPVFIAVFPVIDRLTGRLGIYDMTLVDLRGALILLFGYVCIPLVYAKAEHLTGKAWAAVCWGTTALFTAVAVWSNWQSLMVEGKEFLWVSVTVPACVLVIMIVWMFVGGRAG